MKEQCLRCSRTHSRSSRPSWSETLINNLLTLLCAIITGKVAQLIHVLCRRGQQDRELTAIVLNIVIVPPMLMVFGELTPKSVATETRRSCKTLCKPLNFIRKLLAPILKIFQIAVNATIARESRDENRISTKVSRRHPVGIGRSWNHIRRYGAPSEDPQAQ